MAKSTQPTTPKGAPPPSEPELVVVMRPETGFRASAGRFASMAGAPTDSLSKLLRDGRARLRPLFGPTEERVLSSTASASVTPDAQPIDLSTFYHVEAPADALPSLQASLVGHDLVDGAYIKPGSEPATINDMAPAPQEAPPSTPDFTARQAYLEAAPGGIEARWAWTQAGGRGDGVRIVDVEGAWRFTHEDLLVNQGGVVGGTPSTDIAWRNHGTAVLGEFSGDVNAIGITGISPNAVVSAISIFGATGSAGAINAAAARLGAGDVILIELHRPGPRFAFANRADQRGYIAVEWWPDDFAAIRNAVNRGIIVIEAGGNGAENLDDNLYQTAAAGFPAGWTNPFRRANRDSGAIVVGAGAPPPGTHGRTYGADRSRLDFSNFGALVDAQGWGREVTTCGYGDLQGGANEDLWYTDTFSGTSSASPILVGVAASLQGMARARGRPALTPAQFRNCLRTTGSPQQDEPGRPATQRIGARPNLRELSVCAFGKGKEVVKEVTKEVKEFAKELKDSRKETKEAKEFVKDTKELAKEQKDAHKDTKEAKEFVKDTKELSKDLKDGRKETKEAKEFVKDNKEIKELKERPDKNPKEKDKEKDVVEGGGGGLRGTPGIGPQAAGADVEGRLAAIEGTLDALVHFITQDQRPDLAGQAFSQGSLGQQEQDAKQQKDQKDNEGF